MNTQRLGGLRKSTWPRGLLAACLTLVTLVVVAEPWPELELAWLIGFVLLVTAISWRRRRTLLTVACAGILLIASVWLAIQWLPLHSAGWGTLDKIEIGKP